MQGLDQFGIVVFYCLIEEVCVEIGVGVLMVSYDLLVVMWVLDWVICLNGYVCCQGMLQVVSVVLEYCGLFGVEVQGMLVLYCYCYDYDYDYVDEYVYGLDCGYYYFVQKV